MPTQPPETPTIAKLHETVARLNTTAEHANSSIKAAEVVLSNIGVGLVCTLSPPFHEDYKLTFDKVDGSWRLCARFTREGSENVIPLSECPRLVRVLGARQIPQLIETLLALAEEQVRAIS